MSRRTLLVSALGFLVGFAGIGVAAGWFLKSQYEGATASQWAAQLGSTDPDAQIQAAQALGKLGPDAKSAVPAMIEAFRAAKRIPSDGVRRALAEAFGEIGPDARDAAPTLVEAFADVSGLDGDVPPETLVRIGPGAVRAIVRAIKRPSGGRTDGWTYYRIALINVLGEIGPGATEAVPTLEEILHTPRVRYLPGITVPYNTVDENAEVREAAAQALGKIGVKTSAKLEKGE